MENTNGVIKKLTSAERSYYTAAEVREMMGVSRDTAYRMIRSLRSDLIADGQLAKGYPSIKVAVMGCAVNGPGEAREADFGVAGGDGQGLLFANGEIVRSAVPEDKLAEELLALIRKRIFAQ